MVNKNKNKNMNTKGENSKMSFSPAARDREPVLPSAMELTVKENLLLRPEEQQVELPLPPRRNDVSTFGALPKQLMDHELSSMEHIDKDAHIRMLEKRLRDEKEDHHKRHANLQSDYARLRIEVETLREVKDRLETGWDTMVAQAD